MSQAERLKAIEHEVQVLGHQFRIAADRGKTHGDKILNTLNRIEAKLNDHTDAAKNGYRVLYDRANDIYREVHLLTLMNERILDSINTTNPDRAKALAQ